MRKTQWGVVRCKTRGEGRVTDLPLIQGRNESGMVVGGAEWARVGENDIGETGEEVFYFG